MRSIQNHLAVAYARLSDAALQAYRSDQIIHFNYALREFREGLDQRWPDSRQLVTSMDVAAIALQAAALFEKARWEKLRSKRAR